MKKDRLWWIDEESRGERGEDLEESVEEESSGKPVKEQSIQENVDGWSDYGEVEVLKGAEKPRRFKQKIQITSIDRILKFYAVTSGLLGASLLLSGEYLWAGVVFSSILALCFIGRWAKWGY